MADRQPVVPYAAVRDDVDLTGRRVGLYILRERIGTGGYGAIYRGEQSGLDRDVAIKILHRRSTPPDREIARLIGEARLAARVVHDSSIHVYDLGWEPDGGFLWIAMELVDGVTLSNWRRAHGPMSLELFVPLFERIAEVVQKAHERGIVHRDLKPANIMLVEGSGGRLLPKLLDFGVAALIMAATDASQQATRDGGPCGSTPYISPEQWRGDPAGHGSDLYALGVIAYEALTGERPFRGAVDLQVIELHLHGEVPPVGDRHPPALDRFFRRALAKHPADRWGTALELAAALRAASGLSSRAPRAAKAPRDAARDQLWAAARSWQERGRPPGLLWRGRALAEAERLAGVSDVEATFVAAGGAAQRRTSWIRRALTVTAAASALAAIQYRAVMHARLADERALEAETEQGRAALLHGDPDAASHLSEAQRRGADVGWMLDRAEQPLRAELAVLPGAGGRMWAAAWSPDGRRIVTTDDSSARIWDATTRQLLYALPHRDLVYAAAWSDRGGLVTACGDGVVRIWDAATGRLRRELRASGTTPVRYYRLAVSGDTIAASDTNGAVTVVWSAASGAVIAELTTPAAGAPVLAFSADGRWLAMGGGADVHVYAVGSWSAGALTISGRIRALAWDPTGSRLTVGTTTGDVAIYDVQSGTRLHHLREVGDPIAAITWAPDGARFATDAEIWRADGTLQARLRGGLAAMGFSPDGQSVTAVAGAGAVVVADAATGLPVATLGADVRSASFAPVAPRVLSVGRDGAARVWDATPPYRRWASAPVAADCGATMSGEPDRRYIAIGCREYGTQIWNTTVDRLVGDLPAATGDAFPAVSIAGDRAAIARGDAVGLYELPGGRLIRSVDHGAAVTAVAFAPTGHELVSGDAAGGLLVTRDGQPDVALPHAEAAVDAVAILPSSRVIAASGFRLRVVGADLTTVIADIEVPVRVRLLRPSPDGRRLVAVAALDGRPAAPVLFDLVQRRALAELGAAGVRVLSARWVDDGRIVTAGNDGTARLWSATGELVREYHAPTRLMADAVIIGDWLVGGDAEGALRFWDADTGQPVWTLQAHTSYVVGIHREGGDIVTRGWGGDVARWSVPSVTRQ